MLPRHLSAHPPSFSRQMSGPQIQRAHLLLQRRTARERVFQRRSAPPQGSWPPPRLSELVAAIAQGARLTRLSGPSGLRPRRAAPRRSPFRAPWPLHDDGARPIGVARPPCGRADHRYVWGRPLQRTGHLPAPTAGGGPTCQLRFTSHHSIFNRVHVRPPVERPKQRPGKCSI